MCVVIFKGEDMSVNFGYGGYGMMNGMGMNSMNIQGGGVYQSIAEQYSCPACYQYGPVPYNYKSNVNPIPQYSYSQSWLSKLVRRIVGG